MRNCAKQISKYERDEVALSPDERADMRERRNANRTRLKKGLAANGKPGPIGCYSQGSYAMWTMVQDDGCDYDIDDGVYFGEGVLVGPNGGVLTPLSVRQMVCEALQDQRFKKAPEVKKNCVRVYYNEGYHVDVPAYRRRTRKNPWSGKDEIYYELASADWKESDPRGVTEWFKQTNKDLSPDATTSDGQFRRVVRLLKMFARSRDSWKGKTATGFMLTKLAQECFVAAKDRDDKALRDTMKAIKSRLDLDKVIRHPKLAINITSDNDARPEHFRARMEENLAHLSVLDTVDCTHAKAMAAWDKVFCTSWFAQQPQPNEDQGSGGAPKRAVEKAGGGRYA